jgi:hypothetical protein
MPISDPGPGRSLLGLFRNFERGRRFWRHVRVGHPDECWLWEGEVDTEGRGWFRGDPAEIRAYELAVGPPPPARAIEHRCGELRCVNPEHLQLAPPAS